MSTKYKTIKRKLSEDTSKSNVNEKTLIKHLRKLLIFQVRRTQSNSMFNIAFKKLMMVVNALFTI